MNQNYEAWLRSQGYDEGTVTAQQHRVRRVEQHYGDLDALFRSDRLEAVLDALVYSTDDQRAGRKNPTPLAINGDLRNNLASYRNAVARYRRFLDGESIVRNQPPPADGPPPTPPPRPAPKSLAAAMAVPHEHAKTLGEFGFDGQAALAAMIAASRYRTVAQAIASLTAFSHPDTVAQTRCGALFPTIRGVPGSYVEVDGRGLMLDDNKSPTDAFLWCNGLNRRGRDTQFNHIYAASTDPEAYTALPNIVMTPAFLAKLTDTSDEVKALLAWRSFDLYGWAPAGFSEPTRPSGYAALEWAAPLPAVHDLKGRLEAVMARRVKDRTVGAARRLGWLFDAPMAAEAESTITPA